MSLLHRRSPIDAQDPLEEVCLPLIPAYNGHFLQSAWFLQLWQRALAEHKAMLDTAAPSSILGMMEAAAAAFAASLAPATAPPVHASPTINDAVLLYLLTSPKPAASALLGKLSEGGKRLDVYNHLALQFAKQFVVSKLPYATDPVRLQVKSASRLVTVVGCD